MTSSYASANFARLEYGKLCESLEGPILSNADVGALAWSSDFPAFLRIACTPTAFGFGEDTQGIETARSFGDIIVVLPLLLPTREIARVGARFRRRSENGEEQRGREFWRARFLYSNGGEGNVTELATALMDSPLSGWTRESTLFAGDTAPRRAGDIAGHWPDQRGFERWGAEVVPAVERGVPVGVRAPFPRERFFILAGMLEMAIPAKLRRLFSAGWGIATEQATSVAFSCSRDLPSGVSIYDPAEDQWFPEHLQGHPRSDRRASAQFRWLSFDSSEVQSIFRAVGSELADERRLYAIRRWLSSGDEGSPPTEAMQTWQTRSGLARAVEMVGAELSIPESAARSESLLLAILRGPNGAQVVGLDATLSPLLSLLVALVNDEPLSVLAALRGVTGRLPPWARSRLDAALDRTLMPTPAAVTAHARLLVEAHGCAPDVAPWMARNARPLALLLGSLAPETTRGPALRALLGLSQAPEAALVHDILYGPAKEITPATLALAAPLRGIVLQLAARRWGTPGSTTAADRSAALGWLLALGAPPNDPLLHHRRPTTRDVADLASAVREDCVPGELLDNLAARVLRFWPDFREEVAQHWPSWKNVLTRWPAQVAVLLVPHARFASTEVVPVSSRAPEIPVPSAGELEAIGLGAAAAGAFEGQMGTQCAQLYLGWCQTARPPFRRGGLVEAVAWALRGGDAPDAGHDEAAAAAALFARVPLREEQKLERWRNARTPGALLLLTRVFGGPIEPPGTEQLVLLLERSHELAEMLRTETLREMKCLELCTAAWQAFDVRTDTACQWRPEYRRTLLCGLFAGLRREDEAPMHDMLNFFARRSGRGRWELALGYLRRRGSLADTDDTKTLLWRDVVERACLMASVDATRFDLLLRFSERRRTSAQVDVADSPSFSEPLVVLSDGSLLLHSSFAVLLGDLGDPQMSADRFMAYCNTSTEGR